MTHSTYQESDNKWMVLSGPLARHEFTYRTESEARIAIEAYEAGVDDGRARLARDVSHILEDPNGYSVNKIIR